MAFNIKILLEDLVLLRDLYQVPDKVGRVGGVVESELACASVIAIGRLTRATDSQRAERRSTIGNCVGACVAAVRLRTRANVVA